MKLLVIGSSNMDIVLTLPRIPAVGETVLGGKSSMIFGGKGANQAVAAKRSGAEIAFICKVGHDIFGENMKSHFENEGFDLKLILTDPEEATGIAQIFVSKKGENSIAVAPGANMKLLPEDLKAFEKNIENAEVVLVQLETPLETIEYIADIAHRHKVKLILNPAPAQKLGAELLKKIWLITPNETEASLLTGVALTEQNWEEKAAAVLQHMGVENVIITLGEKGSILFGRKETKRFEALQVAAVDSTAAGDVFNGTLAAALTQNLSLNEAIAFASVAAALSVTKKGAQPSIPTLSEIENFRMNQIEYPTK
ncbi:ribokinase [Marinilongibacter aquaticus]|uniref:ribokinase n=1 Tax=Marinilongibacter aquaticus TaxID=2975157 RepID=UPI0021BDF071|nr:ribokinase [Marinilongibacter aquaticus]UBM59786.1 ribokinase [Marinilongibacter aquaticus]